jgi:hypothetical protein
MFLVKFLAEFFEGKAVIVLIGNFGGVVGFS